MPKEKIMVIGDEEIIRIVYKYELEEEEYEVVCYESPKNILEKINQEKPDLVLLNIKLPEYNGLSVLQEIRKDTANYGLPIILVSAYSFKEDLKSIHVVKSSDFTELKSKIKSCLEGRV